MALTLRRSHEDRDRNHYQVYAGAVRIGTIYFAVNVTEPNPAWFWALNAIMSGGPFVFNGYAKDFEAAKAILKLNWEKWAAAAGLKEIE